MSTNVFVDAGYAPDIAAIKALRSDLASEIAQFIKRRQLSQVAAAKMFSIPQPTVSKIVNGRVSGLSLEFLVRMLVRVDIPVVMQTGQAVQHAGAYVAVGKELADTASEAASATSEPLQPIYESDPLSISLAHLSTVATGSSETVLN